MRHWQIHKQMRETNELEVSSSEDVNLSVLPDRKDAIKSSHFAMILAPKKKVQSLPLDEIVHLADIHKGSDVGSCI